MTAVLAERLQLNGSVGAEESGRGRETLVLERPCSRVQQPGLNHGARSGAVAVVLVTGAQTSAAVVDLLRGTGAWQRGYLRPAQRGEAEPPQAAGGGVLALTSSEKQHTVSVDHSRVAHEPGWTGPETTGPETERPEA